MVASFRRAEITQQAQMVEQACENNPKPKEDTEHQAESAKDRVAYGGTGKKWQQVTPAMITPKKP